VEGRHNAKQPIRCQNGCQIKGVETSKTQKTLEFTLRMGGRVVECGGLENRCGLKPTGGSNPSPSA
jgi:hypothetical protein